MTHTGPRLVDELRADALARGLALPGELELCHTFADFEGWPGDADDVEAMLARANHDPAFMVTGYSRWVVFARIRGQIRYYAAPIPAGAPAWYWSGEDPARRAAVDAEPEYCELAILSSVADCVTLTTQYLAGTALQDVDIQRIPPPWTASSPPDVR